MASRQELRDHEDEHEHDAVRAADEDVELEHDALHATDEDVEVEREEGAPEPAELDPETKARRDAAMRIIRRFGDPVLRASAVPVERFDERLQVELARMGELMHDALGIGLAATQLGRAAPRAGVPHRPRGAGHGARQPGARVDAARSSRWPRRAASACPACTSTSSARRSVRVRAQDPEGQELTVEAEGLRARVIQHEMDHLDGVLILDHISKRGAQGGDARDARGPGRGERRLAASAPGGLGDRLHRHLAVRRRGARAARRRRAPAGARDHPSRPARGPRPAAAIAPGGRDRAGARAGARAARRRQRPGLAGADRRRAAAGRRGG